MDIISMILLLMLQEKLTNDVDFGVFEVGKFILVRSREILCNLAWTGELDMFCGSRV